MLDPDTCYRALLARDHRFDGVFFTGVKTTGVYCRPVCPSRTPLRRNCTFFQSPSAAEASGFRPCLRCRPELAPGAGHAGTAAEPGSPAQLAHWAASQIRGQLRASPVNAAASMEFLAKRAGVSARQLRRIVRQHLGASPVALAQTARLLLAKQLLTDTRISVERVAQASGFGSLRRMQTSMRARYKLSPTQLRRSESRRSAIEGIHLQLSYRPPMQWQTLLHFLAHRAVPGAEHVDEALGAYARTWRSTSDPAIVGWWSVRPASVVPASPSAGPGRLDVELSDSLAPVAAEVLATIRRIFDLDSQPSVVDAALAQDPTLAPLVARRPGLRIPGAGDGFEIAMRAILGQQVSVKAAGTLAERTASAFGEALPIPAPESLPQLKRLAPTAARMARATVDEVAAIGLPGARAAAILHLAREVNSGKLRIGPSPDPAGLIAQLLACPGIGPWTAHYVAMRAMPWPDAFPAGDLILRRALGDVTERQAAERSKRWSPWRAYAALHLWTASTDKPT